MRNRVFLLAVALVALLANPASAATSGTGFWPRFCEYWLGLFQKQSGVALLVILVGIVSIFIITRAKWRK